MVSLDCFHFSFSESFEGCWANLGIGNPVVYHCQINLKISLFHHIFCCVHHPLLPIAAAEDCFGYQQLRILKKFVCRMSKSCNAILIFSITLTLYLSGSFSSSYP